MSWPAPGRYETRFERDGLAAGLYLGRAEVGGHDAGVRRTADGGEGAWPERSRQLSVGASEGIGFDE